jgi:hypothetical protein
LSGNYSGTKVSDRLPWKINSMPLPLALKTLPFRVGFIQKQTFKKTGFQIPVFPKKKKVKTSF